MKNRVLILCMLIALGLSGCTGNKASELFETARFEELQNNKEHARKLYTEIIQKYPDSDFAKKAGERLLELEK